MPIRCAPSSDGVTPRSRYCSNACRQRSYRRRQRVTHDAVPIGSPLMHLSSFVGRTDEMIEAGRLLQNARVLTLTGPGGVGKTRMALELASRAQRARRCASAMVTLEQVTDVAELRRHLAEAVGGAGVTGGSTGAQQYDAERLLVLDGCEHLLDDCGDQLSRLLPARPHLRVLVTSREPLRLPGETVFSLGGLTMPRPDRGTPLTECLRSHAVLLFLDRARTIASDFQLTQDNAPFIGEICRRLEGLPLAIEMAARLVRVFPLAEVVERLDDVLGLLTSGWRLADSRHQSLRASLQWSYDLLSQEERLLYRRLSVLPGGFGAGAAAAVFRPNRDSAAETAELLIALEAKSLIMPCAGQGGAAWFRMLEPVRRHGHEQLAAEGEEAETYGLLLSWLTGLCAPLHEKTYVPPATLRRIATEGENIAHLLGRLHPDDDRHALLAGALATAVLSEQDGAYSSFDVMDLITDAVGRTSDSSLYRGIVLEGAAMGAAGQGDFVTALHHVTQAIERERSLANDPLLCRLLLLRGTFYELVDEVDSASEDLQEALVLARRPEDIVVVAQCRSGLARADLREGALGDAERGLGEALPVLRAARSPRVLRPALITAGMLALEKGDLSVAEGFFTEVMEESADQSREFAGALEGLALVAARTSHHEVGLRLIGAVTEIGQDRLWGGAWWRTRVQAAYADALQALPAGRAAAALRAGKESRRNPIVEITVDPRRQGTSAPSAADLLLSAREREVVALVMDGLTNRQIAARLHVSVRTVETHIRNIRTSHGLRSRAHIAAWAAERGMNME